MIKSYCFIVCLLALIFVPGCGGNKNIHVWPPESGIMGPDENLIVLLPDPDGHVGQVTVTGAGGSQVITQAGYGCGIYPGNKAVTAPRAIDEESIQEIFGKALEIQPELPLHFLLYCKVDKAELDDPSIALIPEIMHAIKERDSVDIGIVGHTDTRGTKNYNYELSEKRALAVKNMLLSEGVHPDVLEITYRGEEDPLIKTGDNVYERRNRRVEVIVR